LRILAFRHEEGGDLGTIHPALESRGIAVQCVDLFAGDSIPSTRDASGLIFMGGAMCANDDLPFLHQELELIQLAAREGLPVFGVCLGAQLIARALGATVYESAVQETGWQDIHIEGDASSDPVFQALPPATRVFQLHRDTFDLPEGAVRLAASDACENQAFRWGRAVYGVQFHPEMTPGMIAEWSRELDLPRWTETPASCANLAQTCVKMIHGWSALL
jgi:GMP synthase-like glutamine amidotransferase